MLLVHSPAFTRSARQHPQAEERFNARYCDLDTLLQEADFVCLILPLSEETHHLFGEAQFAMCGSATTFGSVSSGESFASGSCSKTSRPAAWISPACSAAISAAERGRAAAHWSRPPRDPL
jgi:hypothetical protein